MATRTTGTTMAKAKQRKETEAKERESPGGGNRQVRKEIQEMEARRRRSQEKRYEEVGKDAVAGFPRAACKKEEIGPGILSGG